MSSPEEQRFTEVYVAHYANVLAYALRRCGADDALDAAAEVFTVAWRRLDELPTEVALLPWLYGVAARVLANQRRGSRRRQALSMRMNGVAVIRAMPEVTIGEADHDGQLVAALGTLNEQDREIVLLNAWEGLAAAEIALMYEISAAAAEKRLSRAKARLKRAMQLEVSEDGLRTSARDSEWRR
ncbi:MAG: RNA polymerase sigma factor [Acidimicrobiales bacterium]